MHPARIAELLRPFLINSCHSEQDQRPAEEPAVLLTDTQLNRISTYIDLLLRWNSRINLTAIRNPEEIVTRHFGESLFAARHLFPVTTHLGTAALGCPLGKSSEALTVEIGSPALHPALSSNREGHDFSRANTNAKVDGALALEVRRVATDRARVADVGSGAGFPGIPIKLWAPEVSVTLIESNHKKATFLREVIRSLTLTDVDIQNVRADEITDTFDIVTFRAVERFTEILPVAARLLAPHGRLALLIASSQVSSANSILPHLSWQAPIPIPESDSRQLVIAHAGSKQ